LCKTINERQGESVVDYGRGESLEFNNFINDLELDLLLLVETSLGLGLMEKLEVEIIGS